MNQPREKVECEKRLLKRKSHFIQSNIALSDHVVEHLIYHDIITEEEANKIVVSTTFAS